MPSPYIPTTDAAVLGWLENFRDVMVANGAAYGLAAGDVASIVAAVDAFVAAYAVATTPATRTTPAIAQKDSDRNAAVGLCRVYAIQIKASPGVTDMMLEDAGIHVNDPTPTPIAAPVTSPIVSIVGATALSHTLRYADETTPDKRAKPFGAIQLQLYVTVAAAADPDPANAAFYGAFTKQPLATVFGSGQAGMVATYFGRWVTRTGLVGPWSLPASMTIAGG